MMGLHPAQVRQDDSKQDSTVVVVGSANVDLVLRVDRVPAPGETLLASSMEKGCGGKGANQAVACARDGGNVWFIGAVGADPDGERIRQQLDRDNVDLSLVRTSTAPTGLAVVNVGADAENSIVVAPGANSAMTSLNDRERQHVRRAAVVLLQLELPVNVVVETAGAHSGMVVLNAAPACELPTELLSRIDVLVVNESEAAALADVVDQVPVVVITLGAAGVQLREHGKDPAYFPGKQVTAVDTTAAGDTFCGVLAAQLSRGADWTETIHRANAAASITVQRLGAQVSIPTAAETDARLNSQTRIPSMPGDP